MEIGGGAGSIDLVTDRVGSRPIYWGIGPTGLRWGDDALAVAAAIGSTHLDPEAVVALLLQGFTAGETTLLSGVAEVPPATVAHADATTRPVSRRYWEYDLRPEDRTRRSLMTEGLSVFDLIGHRQAALTRQLGVDRVSVGLTAGRDSRVLVALLSSRGIEVCATTVQPVPAGPLAVAAGIRDVATGSRVAQAMGVEHRILPHWVESASRAPEEIVRAIGPTTTIGVAGVPLALGRHGLGDADALATGHLGDMMAGSHFGVRAPRLVARGEEALADHLVRSQLRRSVDAVGRWVIPEIRPLVGHVAEDLRRRAETVTGSSAYARMQRFDLEVRQTRYILRDAIALGTLGPTLMPFLDHDWMDFWSTVPVDWQIGTPLYETLTKSLLVELSGANVAAIPVNGRPLRAIRHPVARRRLQAGRYLAGSLPARMGRGRATIESPSKNPGPSRGGPGWLDELTQWLDIDAVRPLVSGSLGDRDEALRLTLYSLAAVSALLNGTDVPDYETNR